MGALATSWPLYEAPASLSTMVSPLASALGGHVAMPITGEQGGSGGGSTPPSDLAAALRALDTANGGSMQVTMLDPHKAGRAFSDFEGTAADAEADAVALVASDTEEPSQLVGNSDFSSGVDGWSAGLSGATLVGSSGAAVLTGGGSGGRAIEDGVALTAGRVYVFRVTTTALTGNATIRIAATVDGSPTGQYAVSSTFSTPGTRGIMYVPTSDVTVYPTVTVDLSNTHAFDDAEVWDYGRAATQSAPAEQPTIALNAFGQRVLEADGTSTNMDLPDGALGDGTKHVAVVASYALDNANSDAFPRIVAGASGAGFVVFHDDSTGNPRSISYDGASGDNSPYGYERALTDHESVVRADTFVPSGTNVIRINGVEVASDAHGYASFDDPGAGTIFGQQISSSMAGTLTRLAILVSDDPITTEQIKTAENWCAEGANLYTLLSSTPLAKVMRNFVPDTDLNVSEDFVSGITGYSDASAGSSSISHDAGGERLQLTVVSAAAAAARRNFGQFRPGRRYRVTVPNDAASAGEITVRVGASAGSSSYSGIVNVTAGNSATPEFTYLGGDVHLQVSSVATGDNYATSATIEEIPAQGTFWNLKDETKMYSDLAGSLVTASDPVELIRASATEDDLGADEWAADVIQSDWTDNGGNSYTYDGTNDAALLYATTGAPNGVLHRIEFTVSGLTSGSVTLEAFGGGSTESFSADGAYERYIIAPNGNVGFRGATANAGTTVAVVSLQQVLNYPLLQSAPSDQPTWNGSEVDFPGTGEYLQAVDPDGDLAFVGDYTAFSAITPGSIGSTMRIMSAGTSVGSATAFSFGVNGSGKPYVRASSGAGAEAPTFTGITSLVAATSYTLSFSKSGNDVVASRDVADIDTDTFSIVTTPDAGGSPVLNIGAAVDETLPFEGSLGPQVIIGHALPTGLHVLNEGAIQELAA